VRYTGLAIGYTLGTLATSTVPIIATYLMDKTGAWQSIAIYMSITGVISLVAAALMKEYSDPAAQEIAETSSVH
ncbi:MFS transporter, partial [Rhodococcus sp. IEGM 1379]|nr:MFS transporter [Rhodococcus sp. IEGM 1379]